jgi:hypothetical protein
VYRIDWELFLHVDVAHLLECLLLFAIFDFVFACRTKARWFVLHLFANLLVVITAWPDVVATLRDPANGIVTRGYSVWPTYFVRERPSCLFCFVLFCFVCLPDFPPDREHPRLPLHCF